VSRITDLNDPFEWSFGFDGSRPENIEENLRERHGLIQYLSERFGLICFCERVKDPVIWSHYEDCHRGIAIEIAADLNEAFIRVEYSPERPILPQNCLDNREQHIGTFKDIFGKFFRFKASSWEYEREWRAVVPLDKCDVAEGMFLWKIPDNFITRLIIGIRSPVSSEYLRRSLDIHGFKDVQVVKATESLRHYEIDC
jgi:hypothetical protein